MSIVPTSVFAARSIFGSLCELARYAFRFGCVMMLPKARLAARVLAAESQLAIELNCPGGRNPRRQFTAAFRLLWVRCRGRWTANDQLPRSLRCGG